jgi:hypothetical protein
MQTRWDRLHDALDAAGITHRFIERPYPGGVSRSIDVRLENGEWICVNDKFWRDSWAGWNVSRQDRDGFATDILRKTKRIGEVVAAVRSAMAVTA